MTPFELAEPVTLNDVVSLLDADDPSVRPIAGGTALMLMMKAAAFARPDWGAFAASRNWCRSMRSREAT